MNGGWGISYEIALRWMPLDCTDDKSALVQVMAWCRQATSHYLSQCWPRSMLPNGVTRPQWVKPDDDMAPVGTKAHAEAKWNIQTAFIRVSSWQLTLHFMRIIYIMQWSRDFWKMTSHFRIITTFPSGQWVNTVPHTVCALAINHQRHCW